MSNNDYQLELLERAFLLQQKRIWSLETLLKLQQNKILQEAKREDRQNLIDHLFSNLRVAKECLNDVANHSGFESSLGKLFDPQFVLGVSSSPMTTTLEKTIEAIDTSEQEAGVHNLNSMLRELKVRHEPYLEDVHEKIRKDVAFYRACASFDLDTNSNDFPEKS